MTNMATFPHRTASALMLIVGALGTGEEPARTAEINEAIALGRTCNAPIVRIAASGTDFDVFIESPLARIALLAATAMQMHLPFDASMAERQMTTTYRIWADYALEGRRNVSIDRIVLEGPDEKPIEPIDARTSTFTLGHVPSHGIIEALRFRPGESTFDHLPPDDFRVILRTSAGLQRYRVTKRDRTTLLRVCT